MNRRDFLKRFAYVPLVAAAAPVYFLPPKGGWVTDGVSLRSMAHPWKYYADTYVGCHYDSLSEDSLVRMIYEARSLAPPISLAPTVLHVTDPLGRAILANEELARALLPSLTAKPYTLL